MYNLFIFFFLFTVPGKTKKSDRNSCSHQLCECDREFGMCLQKHLPCPSTKVNPKLVKLFDFPIENPRNPLPYIFSSMLEFFRSCDIRILLYLDIRCSSAFSNKNWWKVVMVFILFLLSENVCKQGFEQNSDQKSSWIKLFFTDILIGKADGFALKVSKSRKQNSKFSQTPKKQRNFVHFFALASK